MSNIDFYMGRTHFIVFPLHELNALFCLFVYLFVHPDVRCSEFLCCASQNVKVSKYIDTCQHVVGAALHFVPTLIKVSLAFESLNVYCFSIEVIELCKNLEVQPQSTVDYKRNN